MTGRNSIVKDAEKFLNAIQKMTILITAKSQKKR